MRRLKHLWFVYQFGTLDFIATSRKQAEEMAVAPCGNKRPYAIEKWELHNNKYRFKKTIRDWRNA